MYMGSPRAQEGSRAPPQDGAWATVADVPHTDDMIHGDKGVGKKLALSRLHVSLPIWPWVCTWCHNQVNNLGLHEPHNVVRHMPNQCVTRFASLSAEVRSSGLHPCLASSTCLSKSCCMCFRFVVAAVATRTGSCRTWMNECTRHRRAHGSVGAARTFRLGIESSVVHPTN